jgi:hypothetical protein
MPYEIVLMRPADQRRLDDTGSCFVRENFLTVSGNVYEQEIINILRIFVAPFGSGVRFFRGESSWVGFGEAEILRSA